MVCTTVSVPSIQVFVCGPYPHWLFMAAKGSLRIHPMGIDGWVTSCAPFHNVNCPKGFLYFNKQVSAVLELVQRQCTRLIVMFYHPDISLSLIHI